MDKGTYDGNVVPMLVFASVGFLFPLHAGGRYATKLVDLMERAAAVGGARRVMAKPRLQW